MPYSRLAAIDSMTRTFRENRSDKILTAGTLCTSDQLARKFEVFNNAKNTFVHLITKTQRIYDVSNNYTPGRFISTLLRNDLKQSTQRPLFDLATREQIIYNQIDLQACRCIFAKVTHLKEQLRANYAYFEDGVRIPKSTPLSGVVVLPQKSLPRLQWRQPPSQREHIEPRIQRESSIHDEPFIAEIGLYRYR